MLGKRIINTATGAGAACTTDTVQILGDTSCVAYYKMSDATDETGSYDGTPTNVNFNVAGKFGNAGEFNGSSSKIDISATSTTPLDFSSKTFTISAWINGSGFTTDDRSIISKYSGSDNTTSSFIFDVRDNDQKLRFTEVNGTSALGFQSAAAIPENTWTHVVYVRTATTCEFFINGVSSGGSQSRTTSINSGSTTDISIGERQASKRFIGKIDQVRIFDRAITANEVTKLYNEVYCQPTIVPTNHFEPVLFTGDNTSSKFIDVGFTPDLVWLKSRDTATSNALYDTVRGNNLRLVSNGTGAEDSVPNELVTGGFNIIGSTGYNDSSLGNQVSWNWKAGGAAVSNTDGTITSQVSANQDAGFSIVKYSSGSSATGTVGHGLSQPPQIVIQKGLGVDNWFIANNLVNGGTNYEYLLFTTGAQSTSWTFWDGANAPNSSTFKNGWDGNREMINYCFHSVDGMSKFGSYVGNGASNFIVTGFRPAYVMIKCTTSTQGWSVSDNKRSPNNPVDKYLEPHTSGAEQSGQVWYNIDYNSNGFTVNGSDNYTNGSGQTYIFMAFAEENVQPQPVLANSFNTVTYTGNGSTQAVTGLGFQPDLVWIKERTSTSGHFLSDSVRGATKVVYSNLTNSEDTETTILTSFDTNGFSVGSSAGVNQNSENYVAWCWKASNESTINQEGSITSVVSANPAAGFSVVKYSGAGTTASVGHGLSSAPDLVIIKNTNNLGNWGVYTSIGGAQRKLLLNSNIAEHTSSSWLNTPTSTVLNIQNDGDSGVSGRDYIAYCFHSVDGYQKIGSYTGGTSGIQVTTGFKPRWVMLKNTTTSGDSWCIFDTIRSGDTIQDDILFANLSSAESVNNANVYINVNSTGFTVANTFSISNGSGNTYIYLAIA